MEAEYIAIYLAAQQAMWVCQFYMQIGLELNKPIAIYSDSQTALNVVKVEQMHKVSKCLDVKYHSIHKQVKCKEIKLIRIKMEFNQAKILTKSLPAKWFHWHLEKIGLEKPSDLDEEENEVAEGLEYLSAHE